jgi:hypothetical protein
MNNAGSSDVRRSRNRVVVHMMIYDVPATRTEALLKQDGRDDRGFEVRSSRFLELRTQNFELRIAPDTLTPPVCEDPARRMWYISFTFKYLPNIIQKFCTHVAVRDTFALTA